jgi:hypothetical protein
MTESLYFEADEEKAMELVELSSQLPDGTAAGVALVWAGRDRQDRGGRPASLPGGSVTGR